MEKIAKGKRKLRQAKRAEAFYSNMLGHLTKEEEEYLKRRLPALRARSSRIVCAE